MKIKINKLIFLFVITNLLSQETDDFIYGVAAIVEQHIILKSDLLQMVNMAAVQNRIDPNLNPDKYKEIEVSVLQSMIDQKIMLEMAEKDSIFIDEKDVNQALEQQVQMFISQAGGEKRAEDALGQSLKNFKREFWYDMQDRLISEKYQQQVLGSITVNRSFVMDFYKAYRDSLPSLPMRAKVRNLLIPIKPNKGSKDSTKAFLEELIVKIKEGESFSSIAKVFSEVPGSKNNGGLLGWVNRGSLVKSFETAAFTAEINDIVGPIETEFGYHILETLEKKGEKIKVRHILMVPKITKKDEEMAYSFATHLKEDSIKTLEDFINYVSIYSHDDISKKIGGDLGWIDPQNYTISEIGDVIKYLEINSCSPPVNSPLGYHLLWIEGIKKGGRPNIVDDWPEIELMALNKKKMDWYDSWIKESRELFFIEIK